MSAPDGLRVRSMMASDVDRVLALERASEAAPHWEREEYLACGETAQSSALRRVGLVAECNEGFAGFAVIRCLTVPGGNEAELESIVVSSEMRKRGIGGGLLAVAIEAAKQHGAKRLDLEVRASNNAAVRLYCRAGFKKAGERRAYYHDPEEDAVLMSITL